VKAAYDEDPALDTASERALVPWLILSQGHLSCEPLEAFVRNVLVAL
jgi:hypothetical protein